MEHTNIVSESATARGCGPIRRLLIQIGAQLVGVPEAATDSAGATWWGEVVADDRVSASGSGARGSMMAPRQVEFWVDKDLQQTSRPPSSVPSRTRAAQAAPVVEARKEKKMTRATAVVNVEKTVEKDRAPRSGGARLMKGAGMSMFKIAKFLHVNGSVYDGRDRGRWLALPGRAKSSRYQLMQPEMDVALPAEFRVARSLPRSFGGLISR